ncbi:hypothetical protein L4D21_27340, partial [Photobacterium profundum]|uniref:hypothetical protein n=1 Tax=Photobacterium profundum TaxID=74109 RepID=UPI003D0FC974
MKKIDAKKRLMFVQNDDYNFLCYIIIVTLDYFKCFNKKSSFKDFRKIAFIANIIFCRNKKDWNSIYYKSQITVRTLSTLIQAMENKGIIELSMNDKNKTVDIWLKKNETTNSFIKDGDFN